MKPNYLDVVVKHYPALAVKSVGDPSVFANIVAESGGTLPSQAEMDAHILQMAKDNMWVLIQEERTRRQNGGVFIQSENKWFHSDQTSRIQQLGLVMMGANLPANINWKTMDGSFIVMTPAIALSIFNAAATLDMMSFAVAEQHRAAMVQTADPSQYNYSGFWPATYTG